MGLVHAFEELLGFAPAESDAAVGDPPSTPPLADPASLTSAGGGGGFPSGQVGREVAEGEARARSDAAIFAALMAEPAPAAALEAPAPPEPAPAAEPPAPTYPGQSFPIPPGVYGPPGPGGVTPYEGPGVRVGKRPIRNPHR